jgi:hypothetical protein
MLLVTHLLASSGAGVGSNSTLECKLLFKPEHPCIDRPPSLAAPKSHRGWRQPPTLPPPPSSSPQHPTVQPLRLEMQSTKPMWMVTWWHHHHTVPSAGSQPLWPVVGACQNGVQVQLVDGCWCVYKACQNLPVRAACIKRVRPSSPCSVYKACQNGGNGRRTKSS